MKKVWHFGLRIGAQFYRDECFMRAAGLAYTTLLSIVPLFTVSFSVLSAFPVFKGLAKQLQNFIFDNFVASSAQTVTQYIQSFVEKTEHITVFGMLFLLITAVLVVFSMERAFNIIWQVKKRRDHVSAFILYWGVITFVPILIGLGMTVTSYLMSLPFVTSSATIAGIKKIWLVLFPYLMTYVAFVALYITLPNCKVPMRSALLAAFPATILFELVKFGFTSYFAYFPTYQLIYGALAALPIFLIWLYVSWLIILFGAVISKVLTTSAVMINEKDF